MISSRTISSPTPHINQLFCTPMFLPTVDGHDRPVNVPTVSVASGLCLRYGTFGPPQLRYRPSTRTLAYLSHSPDFTSARGARGRCGTTSINSTTWTGVHNVKWHEIFKGRPLTRRAWIITSVNFVSSSIFPINCDSFSNSPFFSLLLWFFPHP